MAEFKLSYATMFDPPEELHQKYESALQKVKAGFGAEHAMLINGRQVFSREKFEDRSPINTDWVLAVMQKGNIVHAQSAVDAARIAFPVWSHTPWQERLKILRKAAALIEERIYTLSAAMSLEMGKNRMESLAEVQEAADLVQYYAFQMEEHNGFVTPMGKDPLFDYEAINTSVMRPYGVWLVISPFNFPFALSGGPLAAALIAGNTVILKPASDTPWIVRLLVDCFHDAGVPDGVINFVTGSGSTLGQALIDNPDVDGITFTGSFDVGMQIYKDFSTRNYIRPLILELGGKNPVIVSRHADLELASLGIVRSAFGLQGQKCSAASRIIVEEPVYADLLALLKDKTEKMVVGDPTDRSVYLGPVINAKAYKDFQSYMDELGREGSFLTGGRVLLGGLYDNGYFVQSTFVTDVPFTHRLWQHEMFLPISTIGKVKDLDEAFKVSNNVNYGLTSGFYGSEDEVEKFFDRIEAGVAYANRPMGATTGAWPGFQSFGGWKGSGSTGRNVGGIYYLPQYMHEQSRTLIK